MASPSKTQAQEAVADAAAAAISTAEIAACYVMAHSWGLQEREAQQVKERAEAGESVSEEAAAVAAKHAAGLLGQSSLTRLLASGGDSGSILRLQSMSALSLCEALRAQWTGKEDVVEASAADWRRVLHILTPTHDSTSITVDGIPNLVGGALDAAFQLDGDTAVDAAEGDAEGGEPAPPEATRSPHRHRHRQQQRPRSQRQRAADRERKAAGTVAGVVSQLAMHTMELVAAGTAQAALLAGRRTTQPTKADVTACVACIAEIVDPSRADELPGEAPSGEAGDKDSTALALMARGAKDAVEAAGDEASGHSGDASKATESGADDGDEYDDDGFDSPAKTSRSALSGAGFAPTGEPEQATASSSRAGSSGGGGGGGGGMLSLGAAMVEAAESATAAERRIELRERESRARERENRLQVERSVTRREQRLEAAADEAAAAERAVRAEERREDARLKLLAGEFHPSEEAIQKEIARLRTEKEEKRRIARELRKRHAEEQGSKKRRGTGAGAGAGTRCRRHKNKGDALDAAMEEDEAHGSGGGAGKRSGSATRRSKKEEDDDDAAARSAGDGEGKEAEMGMSNGSDAGEEDNKGADSGDAELDGTQRKTGRRKAGGGKKKGMSSARRLERQQAVFALRAAAYQDVVSVPGATGPKADKRAARRLVPRIKHNHSASAAARAILHSQVPASFHTFHVTHVSKSSGVAAAADGDGGEETKEEHKDDGGAEGADAGAEQSGTDGRAEAGEKERTSNGSSTARGRLRGAAATGKGRAKASAARSRSPRARRVPGRKAASPRKGQSGRKGASPRKRTGRHASPSKRSHKQAREGAGAGLTVGAGTAGLAPGRAAATGGDESSMRRDGEAVASTPQARQRDPDSLSPGSHTPSGADTTGTANAAGDGPAAAGEDGPLASAEGSEENADKSGIVFTVTEDGQMPPLTLPQAPSDQEHPDEAAAAVAAQWAAKGSPRYHASTALAEPAARLKLAARTYNAPQPDRPDPLWVKQRQGGGKGEGKKTRKRRGASPRKRHGKRVVGDGEEEHVDGAGADRERAAKPPAHPVRPKRPQGHRGARGGAGGGPRGARAAVSAAPATSEDPGFDRKPGHTDSVAGGEEDEYDSDMDAAMGAAEGAAPGATEPVESGAVDANEQGDGADYEGEWD